MIKAILFDLDDTLLGNHVDVFIPAYFELLGVHASRYLAQERFLPELLLATQAMIDSEDTAVSNRDVFWQTFQARTGLNPAELEPFFDTFYRDTFPQLHTVTEQRPSAIQLIQFCLDQGLKTVIATNPMFPRRAIEERLRWAGIPVSRYAYTLVTTYENMHATKPSLAYYQEILDKLECPPESALMVGDDWKNDIAPASELGLYTYWTAPTGSEPVAAGLVDGVGTLAALWQRVQDGWLGQLV